MWVNKGPKETLDGLIFAYIVSLLREFYGLTISFDSKCLKYYLLLAENRSKQKAWASVLKSPNNKGQQGPASGEPWGKEAAYTDNLYEEKSLNFIQPNIHAERD